MSFSKSFKWVFIGILLSASTSMSTALAKTEYRVKSTDNLSGIVDRFYKDNQLTRYQIYIGLLAENPHAFRYGNINYLKSKQLLSIPETSTLLAMEKEDADKLVAEHNGYAKKRKKFQLNPPFEGYTPKNSSAESNEIKVIAEKQQAKIEKLKSETEELRVHLEQLMADKAAMDSELIQLDALLPK